MASPVVRPSCHKQPIAPISLKPSGQPGRDLAAAGLSPQPLTLPLLPGSSYLLINCRSCLFSTLISFQTTDRVSASTRVLQTHSYVRAQPGQTGWMSRTSSSCFKKREGRIEAKSSKIWHNWMCLGSLLYIMS